MVLQSVIAIIEYIIDVVRIFLKKTLKQRLSKELS